MSPGRKAANSAAGVMVGVCGNRPRWTITGRDPAARWAASRNGIYERQHPGPDRRVADHRPAAHVEGGHPAGTAVDQGRIDDVAAQQESRHPRILLDPPVGIK
jgi:hypothetical protein